MKLKKVFPIIAMLLIVFLAGCKKDKTGVPPTVTSTVPIDYATSIAFNSNISAIFSVAMDPLTINATTFTLKQGTTPVTGVVTYSGTTATFTPAANLAANTTYTATITTGAKNTAGDALASNYPFSFTTVTVCNCPDVIKPTSISTDPVTTATGVALNKVVEFTFSEPMAPSTINGTTFTLKQGGTAVEGTVTYAGTTATFTPTNPLLAGLPYTATITTGATDVAGNALAAPIVLTFTTDAAPTVTLTDPANLAIGVVLNKAITATFSEPMDPLTITATTFTIKQGTTLFAGTVSCSGSTATFIHTTAFTASTVYTATITTGAKNVLGTPLASDKVWTFTTGATSGTAVGTSDQPATGVPINAVVGLTFNVPMDPATIIAGLTLLDGTTAVPGKVTYSGTTATFTPTTPLVAGHTYTIRLTGAKDLNGIPLADKDWTFTTATAAAAGPLVVDLKTAGDFGILAGVSVNSNGGGASVINGMDVGLYPGKRSSITGFPPATVVGTGNGIYGADDAGPRLLLAKSDLIAAYDQAAGATSPTPILVPAGLGGRTLGPGIYKSASSMKLENGTLTLDAKGDANAVWIFQIGSALTTTGGGGAGNYGDVILVNGAQAKNVFWQVGTSAVIGDGTSFQGTIMALTSITMGTGSTAVGRMLARNGSVVLTSTNTVINSITKP